MKGKKFKFTSPELLEDSIYQNYIDTNLIYTIKDVKLPHIWIKNGSFKNKISVPVNEFMITVLEFDDIINLKDQPFKSNCITLIEDLRNEIINEII